jgi:hypothetical protein
LSDRDLFSAKVGPFTAGSPTSAPIRRVRDVAVCIVSGMPFSDADARHPPIASGLFDGSSEPAVLGRGVRIERLSDEDAMLVVRACMPRGHYFMPVFPLGQRYSFVRDVEPEEWERHRFRWDADRAIWDSLVLSRLVRDNGHSTEFAARIADFEDGKQQVIYTLDPEGRHVYRLRADRDWLDQAEGLALRDLVTAYWADRPNYPGRVGRAMWRMEYASWLMWADLIVPILVSGLEALLKTDRWGATRQFVSRVPRLAHEVGVEGVDAAFCEQMYDARSDWVHGSHVRLFSSAPEQDLDAEAPAPPTEEEQARLADAAVLQDVLRAGVRRCIADPSFRDVFADDDSIRARWPLP